MMRWTYLAELRTGMSFRCCFITEPDFLRPIHSPSHLWCVWNLMLCMCVCECTLVCVTYEYILRKRVHRVGERERNKIMLATVGDVEILLCSFSWCHIEKLCPLVKLFQCHSIFLWVQRLCYLLEHHYLATAQCSDRSMSVCKLFSQPCSNLCPDGSSLDLISWWYAWWSLQHKTRVFRGKSIISQNRMEAEVNS